MGVRYNKRVTIFSWLKANVTKSGVSLTIGPKGKTLNVGSTGVSVNVNLGKGVGYSKRLISWKKINILSWFGLGGTNQKVSKSKAKVVKKTKKEKSSAEELSLDDALKEMANGQVQPEIQTEQEETPQEQAGCSWGCAALGCLGLLVVTALVVVVAVLLSRSM